LFAIILENTKDIKLNVFPVPDFDCTIKFLLLKPCTITADWTGLGLIKPVFSSAWLSQMYLSGCLGVAS
jgi:hypothetical protein